MNVNSSDLPVNFVLVAFSQAKRHLPVRVRFDLGMWQALEEIDHGLDPRRNIRPPSKNHRITPGEQRASQDRVAIGFADLRG